MTPERQEPVGHPRVADAVSAPVTTRVRSRQEVFISSSDVPVAMTETVAQSTTPVREPNTLVNAVVGGVVSVVLGFVPFSPVLGGAVAGYLQSDDPTQGLRVGVYAGLVAAVPLAFVLFLLASVLSFGVVAVDSTGSVTGTAAAGGSPLFALGVLGVVFLVTAVYTVGLSALGGYLGSYVKGR
jgi:hypothetical protein